MLGQVRAAPATAPAASARPVVALESGYDPVALARAQQAQAGLAADYLVRLAAHRVLYRDPGPYGGRGRPWVHGAVFRFKGPTTHGVPDRQATLEHPEYGTVVVSA